MASETEAGLRRLAESYDRLLVIMQAAWIEWKHGQGAEAAMAWIENTLDGPGLIPNRDEPCAHDAQKFFDLNRPDALPLCAVCSEPSHIQTWRGSFCSPEHADRPEREATPSANTTRTVSAVLATRRRLIRELRERASRAREEQQGG